MLASRGRSLAATPRGEYHRSRTAAPETLTLDADNAVDLDVTATGGGIGVTTGEAYAAVYVQVEIENVGIFPGKILRTAR